MPTSLKRAIEAAAAKSGRSQSQEMEIRLERSFGYGGLRLVRGEEEARVVPYAGKLLVLLKDKTDIPIVLDIGADEFNNLLYLLQYDEEMKGCVIRRGKRSWRLKYDVDRGVDGQRQVRYLTVKGTRKQAEAELVKRIAAVNAGTDVAPSEMTVAQWLDRWLARQKLSAKSAETYGAVVTRLVRQIGHVKLQQLKPLHVHELSMTREEARRYQRQRNVKPAVCSRPRCNQQWKSSSSVVMSAS